MGNEKAKAHNAHSSTSYLNYKPEDLVLVKDEKNALYDERVVWNPREELILSIMRHGIIDAVTIRKNGEDANGKPIMEVVAGRQRVMAAIEANKRLAAQGLPLKTVPCALRRGPDLALMGIMVAENEIKRPDEDLIKGKKAQRMLDRGMPIEQIAIDFGVTTTSINNYIALTKCATLLQDAVTLKEISASLARKLAKLPHDEQITQFAKMKADGTLKGAKADKVISDVTNSKSTTRMGKKELESLKIKYLHQLQASPEGSADQVRYEFGYDVVSFIMKNDGTSFDDFYKKCIEERAARGEAELTLDTIDTGPAFGDDVEEEDEDFSSDENENDDLEEVKVEETKVEESQVDDGLEFDTDTLATKVAAETPPPPRTRKKVTRAHGKITTKKSSKK